MVFYPYIRYSGIKILIYWPNVNSLFLVSNFSTLIGMLGEVFILRAISLQGLAGKKPGLGPPAAHGKDDCILVLIKPCQ